MLHYLRAAPGSSADETLKAAPWRHELTHRGTPAPFRIGILRCREIFPHQYLPDQVRECEQAQLAARCHPPTLYSLRPFSSSNRHAAVREEFHSSTRRPFPQSTQNMSPRVSSGTGLPSDAMSWPHSDSHSAQTEYRYNSALLRDMCPYDVSFGQVRR